MHDCSPTRTGASVLVCVCAVLEVVSTAEAPHGAASSKGEMPAVSPCEDDRGTRRGCRKGDTDDILTVLSELRRSSTPGQNLDGEQCRESRLRTDLYNRFPVASESFK